MKFASIIFFVSILFISCQPPTAINESNEAGLEGDVLTIFFNQGKVNILRVLFNKFELEMCGDDDEANRTACYTAHAQKIQSSMTEDNQIKKNVFPYNSNLGLKTYPNQLHLEFIWNPECRKQNGKKYYCLKNEGNYMKFLKEIGRYNPTIKSYHQQYTQEGRVSQELLDNLHRNAHEVLDFNQFNHRLFYLVHHLTNGAYE